MSDPQKLRTLVLGGAGYIGATTAHALAAAGHEVIVADNLSKGYREFVAGFALHEVDITDRASLTRALEATRPDAVLHFAALTEVGGSTRDPLGYYRVNVAGTIGLLGAMLEVGVERLVFSSSAAVYGTPREMPIPEDHPLAPINPYGRTKVAMEQVIADTAATHDLRWAALRYFNAAGADPRLPCGEWHDPETHLIPNALRAAAGLLPRMELFGTDHPTPDGSAVRDYVHVSDLARAHVAALERLDDRPGGRAYNLGIGVGFSVREVIDAAKRVTGVDFEVREGPAREGDPPELVADPGSARDELGWRPEHTEIDDIVRSAWEWFQKNGFNA